MSFSERLRTKLEARQRGEAPIQATATALREQALSRTRPIQEAVARLVMYMAENPFFAATFDASPNIEFLWEPIVPSISTIQVKGKAASFNINVRRHEHSAEDPWTELRLELVPHPKTRAAICCGLSYAGADEIKADARDLMKFLSMVEDAIAELLADIALSDLGRAYFRRGPDRSGHA